MGLLIPVNGKPGLYTINIPKETFYSSRGGVMTEIKDTLKKEMDQTIKNYKEAAADAVPFYKKHKKAVIITVLALLVVIGIFAIL